MRSFIFSAILVLTLQSLTVYAQPTNNILTSHFRVPGFLAGTGARLGKLQGFQNHGFALAPQRIRPGVQIPANGEAFHHEVDRIVNQPIVTAGNQPPTPSLSEDVSSPNIPNIPDPPTPSLPPATEPKDSSIPTTPSIDGPPAPSEPPTSNPSNPGTPPSAEPPGDTAVKPPSDLGFPPLPPLPGDAKAVSVSEASPKKVEVSPTPVPVPSTPTSGAPMAALTSSGPNEIFLAGDAHNTVQFAPSGKAGYVVWRSNTLVYRERIGNDWTEAILATSGKTYSPNPSGIEHRFQPAAILLYDSNSRAHIFRQSGSSLIRHQQTSTGSLDAVEEIPLPGYPELVDAQFGPSDTLHVALVSSSGSVEHGVVANGLGVWAKVAQTRGNPRLYLPQSYAPRYFSLAIDSRNKAHLVFTPELNLAIGAEGYTRPYSQLHYASNKSGQWRTQLVQDIPDKSGDAAYGASIAIGPGDQPVIASWYNERASTGSSQNSRLLWHSLDNSGNWKSTVIADSPNDYVAADGVRGTGFAPYVRFDENGHPHIIFSDHASQHFDTGQNEYAGQIRHVYHNGTEWRAQMIHSQSNPLAQQIIYPAFAVKNGEILVTALERETVWENDYRRARSTYRFLLLSTRY